MPVSHDLLQTSLNSDNCVASIQCEHVYLQANWLELLYIYQNDLMRNSAVYEKPMSSFAKLQATLGEALQFKAQGFADFGMDDARQMIREVLGVKRFAHMSSLLVGPRGSCSTRGAKGMRLRFRVRAGLKVAQHAASTQCSQMGVCREDHEIRICLTCPLSTAEAPSQNHAAYIGSTYGHTQWYERHLPGVRDQAWKDVLMIQTLRFYFQNLL